MTRACERCLRRAYLLSFLAPRIAALLDRPQRPVAGLLTLEEGELIAATAGRRAAAARAFLESFDAVRARRGLDAAGVAAVCRHGEGYPPPLTALVDPPAVLFTSDLRGLAGRLGEPAVAVVGTRRASAYGLEVAHALGRGLAVAGLAVVSGLALGVDAAAHRGCIEGGGLPVAVLAGGLDVPYPRANGVLHEQVRERGILVSELPPGRRPFRWSFPARNRIMAGLAQMTVVVEAAERSGSLITAGFAEDLGRSVGAVPGRVTARRAAGSNALLRDGARVVLGVEDVLDELFEAGAPVARAGVGGSRPSQAEPDLREVLDAVESEESVEGVVRRTGLSAARVRAALARLEASGQVRRHGLGGYARSACPAP